MKIDTIEFNDSVLTLRCSGTFGIGSEGNPSGILITESVEGWMLSHPGENVEQLVVDYTNVEYSWGDGPLSSVIPIIKRGVAKVLLVPSVRNRESLETLVSESNVPWVMVEVLDA